MWKIGLTILLLAVIFTFLYREGYIITQAKTALMFTSSLNGKKARFSRCSGYIKRPVRFREEGRYRFVLSSQLTEGELQAEFSEKREEPLLILDELHPEGTVLAEPKKRYYLTFRFQKASGKYEIRWEKI